jgi:hypothetical protein
MLRFNAHSHGSHHRYRVIRQIHLVVGAWGALAAVLYGATGLVLNHRFGDQAWSQGSSEDAGHHVLQVPQAARRDAESLSLWLRTSRGLDAQVIRKDAKPSTGGHDAGKWTLTGGSARQSWSLDYSPGNATAELSEKRQTTLAALLRLHKAVGGGWGWRLLSDSFAIAMLLLGLSGLWMWARGRSARQMVLSVAGTVSVLLAVVLIPALS